jgi:dihydrofolate reductase
LSKPSAQYWTELIESARGGALVCGRRIFDHTKGWAGNPPMGNPTFVVTHRPAPDDWPPHTAAPFTFVTEGVESAVAQAKAASNGNVSITGANVVQQCLNFGLVDEVRIDLVQVLLGRGIRYFDNIENTSAEFEQVEVVEGAGVTHLRYRVTYP